jgi:hypothetical protein
MELVSLRTSMQDPLRGSSQKLFLIYIMNIIAHCLISQSRVRNTPSSPRNSPYVLA